MIVVHERSRSDWSLAGGCSWCGQPATKRMVWRAYQVGDLLCESHALKLRGYVQLGRVEKR